MYEQRKSLYQAIEAFTASKVICYVTGDRANQSIQIAPDCLDYFTEHLDAIGKTKKISLILYTRGGHTLAAWTLVNLIRQFCDELQVIVVSKAHSAGTLICLGADRVIMTKQATLGPIDPSTNGPLNPQVPGNNPFVRVPVSVESINAYLQMVKDLGITSEREQADILIDLSSKVHPLVLGDVNRARNQIRMLGERLMRHHIAEENIRSDILNFLCSESGSHDYTIHRKEARDILKLPIDKPDDAQYAIYKKLHADITNELQLLIPFIPDILLGDQVSVAYSCVRGLIESLEFTPAQFVSVGDLRRIQTPQGQVVFEDRKTFEGWRFQ